MPESKIETLKEKAIRLVKQDIEERDSPKNIGEARAIANLVSHITGVQEKRPVTTNIPLLAIDKSDNHDTVNIVIVTYDRKKDQDPTKSLQEANITGLKIEHDLPIVSPVGGTADRYIITLPNNKQTVEQLEQHIANRIIKQVEDGVEILHHRARDNVKQIVAEKISNTRQQTAGNNVNTVNEATSKIAEIDRRTGVHHSV